VYKVAAVPIYGIRKNTGINVPSILPSVERADTLPAVPPAFFALTDLSLIAKGDTNPSSVSGMENSSTTPISEPMNMPTE
jgi:hypothetical protein